MKRALNRFFWAILIVAVAGYGGLLWWFGEHQSELVYQPERGSRLIPDSLGLFPQEVNVTSADGTLLVGRIYRGMRPDSTATWVLYFHGNAGNASARFMFHAQLVRLGASVLVAEYRGYGPSSGSPDESGLYKDADAFYAYARTTLGIPPGRLVIYGHSLGSGVAIDLASRVPAAGLIVEGAFTSVVDRGQELYPYLPVAWLATNRFDSLEKIPRVRMSKLFIHAIDDRVIPIAHGRRLFDAAAPPKFFLEVRGGHDFAYSVDRHIFLTGLGAFLERARRPDQF